MEKHELSTKLRKNRMENKRMLKIVVMEKTSQTYKNKFNLEEIIYFCNLLNISIDRLIYGVLQVNFNDYESFILGFKKYLYSEKFIEVKKKYLKSVQKQFNRGINWNIRNYYNRDKIFITSLKWNINPKDFSTRILNKSKPCVRRVLNDKIGQKRFFIGKYIGTKLPEDYVNKNISKLNSIIRCVIYKITSRFGIKLSKDDLEDEYQNSLIFMNFNCNALNRKNKEIISSAEYKEKHGKILYNKLYYYELNRILTRKDNEFCEYNDKLRYDFNNEKSEENLLNTIYSMSADKREIKILKQLADGFTKEDIILKNKISSNEFDEIIKKTRKNYTKHNA